MHKKLFGKQSGKAGSALLRAGFAAALAVASFTVAVQSQAQNQKPSDAAVQPQSAQPAPKDPVARDYSKEGFVIEQFHTSYRFENDGTGRREIRARVRVQSEAGVQQWGQLQLGYNSANEKMEIPYVRVLKEDGTVVKAGDDAVQDLSAPVEHEAPVYTDYRQKHVTVPGLRPGEVLEYDVVTIVHTPLAAGQFWADYNFDHTNIVLDEELEIDVPASRQVKLKNKPGMDPAITEQAGRRVYHWNSSHLEREDDDPSKDPAKIKALKKKMRDAEHLDIQMTTFRTWEEIGRWYASLEKDRRVPSPEVKAKAAELTKGLTTDLDRTEALYDFVAKNFRYVSLSLGVGRYQPHASGEVLHNQYGDCKDKHTLLASLLEAEGLHASSVLINSSRPLDTDVPSPAQFDHVITMLPLGKEEVWMDTTAEVGSFRMLAFTLRKKQALVIPPAELADSTPHLEETPANTPGPNREVGEIDGKINEIGKLDAHVHYTFLGDEELALRAVFRRLPQAQWQRVVENVNSVLGGDVSNVKVSDPAATREPFTVSYDVSRVNFFDWSRKKTTVGLPLSRFDLPDAEADDDAAADAEPVKLGPAAEYVYKVKLELPAKYAAHPPLPFSLKRDYASYEATYKMDGSTFIASRSLAMLQTELPVQRAGDYLSFRRAVFADLGQELAVESTVASAPTPPVGMTADELVESGRQAYLSNNLTAAEGLLRRAAEIDPKNKYVWNILGLVYTTERRYEEAIAAFKTQTGLNPYDEGAYNYLGRVYWLQRDYDDAAAAFRKQLEANPLDKFAHANLGMMYSEWHHYDEAIPELEKAVALTPDSADLQVSLGDAYLNLGQDDKALAAFDRAVELSATPLVWNNIAYQLSLKKAHLDKAQQYAESAVSATTAGLRNVSLDRLSAQDLQLVPSLIAYWDTLGWIYFARGDMDKAEKYVGAAWGLGHHGEVGDHLGQIYEKEGKKDRAANMYALSMNGLRPIQETRDRLAALAGGDKRADASIASHRGELERQLDIDAGKARESGTADFFVLLSGAASSSAHAEGVKFVSGDEKLKSYTDALRTADYHLVLPDDTPVKVLRRGTLICSADSGKCNFVLTLPDDVRTVD